MGKKSKTEPCCEPFDPEPWDEKTITWQDEPFVSDHVRSLFHMPLNFPSVMKRNTALIKAADAETKPMMVLADEKSKWGSDVFIHVSKEVPKAQMTMLSGTYLSKVFEGPYRNMRKWIEEMDEYVQREGKKTKKLLFFYTTCPKCAKRFGKNYVVLLAQVGPAQKSEDIAA